MPDRVTHDHPTVETLEATLGRHGGTHRPEIGLPDGDDVPVGEVIRVVLDGTEYRTEVGRGSDGAPVLRGAYETPRLARNPGEGTDALEPWVAARDLDVGRTVLVDVVDPEVTIGLRAPGERATYATTKTPDDSLAAIAEDVENSS
ncbi:MAG: hypothetical protein ABEJ77_06795 [Halanaeroarchaeum sp.]